MRPIGRSQNAVRVLAATQVPEHCKSGHCGEFCRWSHHISSARGQRNCGPMFKLCRASQSVKARFVTKDVRPETEPKPFESLCPRAQRYAALYCHRARCSNGSLQGRGIFRSTASFFGHRLQVAVDPYFHLKARSRLGAVMKVSDLKSLPLDELWDPSRGNCRDARRETDCRKKRS